jgi:hypothetical protein
MKRRLRVPRVLVVALSTGAIAASMSTACGKDECIRCLPDPDYGAEVGDAGVDAAPLTCPACLPDDGVCPVGCIPEGYV